MPSKSIDEVSQANLPASVKWWVWILKTLPNSNFLHVYFYKTNASCITRLLFQTKIIINNNNNNNSNNNNNNNNNRWVNIPFSVFFSLGCVSNDIRFSFGTKHTLQNANVLQSQKREKKGSNLSRRIWKL